MSKAKNGLLLEAFAAKHKNELAALPKGKGGQPKQDALKAWLGKPENMAELGLILGLVLASLYLEAETGGAAAAVCTPSKPRGQR